MSVRKYGDLIAPILEFAKDVETAFAALEGADSQYNRRAHVRALFAMIEGSVYLLKQAAAARELSAPGVLAVGEMVLLRDEFFDLDDKGEIRQQVKFLRLAENLRFTARMLSKVFGQKIDLKCGEVEWQHFLSTIGVRHRITHPKVIGDFVITDQEIEVARKVNFWFNAIATKSIERIRVVITR